MTRRTRRFPRLALAVVAVGLAAPATSLGYVDHRSPDAIDSGVQAQKAEQMQNELRKLEAERAQPGYVDHRSPDAQDNSFVRSPAPTVAEPTIVASSSGFDWGDAGIGAAGMLALFSIAAGSALLLTSRRRRHGIA
jgi:hypothetical protein